MSINKEDITQNAKEYFDDFINKLIKDRKYFFNIMSSYLVNKYQ